MWDGQESSIIKCIAVETDILSAAFMKHETRRRINKTALQCGGVCGRESFLPVILKKG